ncbi:PKD domain-containing protein [Patescibacteria group bacterium]|nr:PKD domain-containing protein [Patescibacteria group bacterium]
MNKSKQYIIHFLKSFLFGILGLLFIIPVTIKPSLAQTTSDPVCDNLTATINELNVTLTVSAHSPVSSPIFHYYFFFGSNTGAEQGTSTNSLSYQYSSPGHYDVYAYVTDDQGRTSNHCTASYDIASVTPTPTPTPTITPIPTPVNKPTCFVSAYSYGMNVTATVTTQNTQGVLYYYFNFNDGKGDRNFTSNTMTHLYTKEGTYTTTAYVIDNQGQSDRCNSDEYVIAAVPATPTPTPCCSTSSIADRTDRADHRNRRSHGDRIQDPPARTNITQLPKTGTPLLVWSLFGLVPAGLGLRRFKSISPKGNFARFLWERRRLDKKDRIWDT